MIIPYNYSGYESGSRKDEAIQHENMEYYPHPTERIDVVMLSEYPSYRFLVGIPNKSSHRHEKEIAFFEFVRVAPVKNRISFYLDISETTELVDGLAEALILSRENSVHLWEEKERMVKLRNEKKLD